MLHSPSHQPKKATAKETITTGKPFPAKMPENNTFATQPIEQAFKNVRHFGGTFSHTALRPEVAFVQSDSLLPEDKQDWLNSQKLSLWQPISSIGLFSNRSKQGLNNGFFQKGLPFITLALAVIASIGLAMGAFTLGQQIWHNTDEVLWGNTANALSATAPLEATEPPTVQSNQHPLELANDLLLEQEALGLAAISQPHAAKAEKTTAGKTYKRSDPLKPSIELIKHFSVKEEPLNNPNASNSSYSSGRYTPSASSRVTVQPFPSVSGISTAFPAMPNSKGSISIEEVPSVPTIRFVGLVKSKAEGRSVALIEVPNGSGGVQTLAKPLNKPFTLDGQTVTLKKLSTNNQLEASIGSNKQVLGLETSGGELKSAEPKTMATKLTAGTTPVSNAVKTKIDADAEKTEALSDEELVKLLRQLNQP